MKNVVISSVVAGIVISGIIFSGCTSKGGAPTNAVTSSTPSGAGLKLAYVNIDSLDEHYELMKTRRTYPKKRQDSMEAELEQSYQQMQSKGAAIQKKVQDQSLTRSEYEAAQKDMMLMQESFESRKQSLTEKLVKEQEAFKLELKKGLDDYLEQYNKDKHFDFILSYSAAGGSGILYANKALDITKEVIDGINAASPKENNDKKK